jgi:transcription antitermination factor NusG
MKKVFCEKNRLFYYSFAFLIIFTNYNKLIFLGVFMESGIENKKWHVVYSRSRAEKKVLIELQFQGIEAYLPLQRKLRQWSDRKKWIEVPLISGYIFVFITRKEYDKVLQTNGVVTYVRFEGKAAVIPDEQIEYIKKMLSQPEIPVDVYTQLINPGDKVEVTVGPLIGLKGTLVSFRGKKRVAVQIQQLNLSLMVDLPATQIQKTNR